MEPVICPNRRKVIHRQNLASMRDSGRFHKKIANTRKVLRKIRKKKGRRVKGTPAGFPQRFASAPPPATQGPQRGQSRNPREPHFVSVQTARPCLSKPLLHEHRAPLPNPPYSGGRNSRFIQTEKQGSQGKTAVPLRYMPQAASTSRPGKVPRTRQNGPPATFETQPKG